MPTGRFFSLSYYLIQKCFYTPKVHIEAKLHNSRNLLTMSTLNLFAILFFRGLTVVEQIFLMDSTKVMICELKNYNQTHFVNNNIIL